MAEWSNDYHDYVFKDGKLVGKFEEMYRYSRAVPWHQDQQDDWIDVRLTVDLLSDGGPCDEIHDLGCGLGHYLALMCERLGTERTQGFGYDISETACARATKSYPEFRFTLLDLTRPPERSVTTTRAASSASRLFMIRGTLWYVFPKLANVVSLIRSLMAPGDELLVVQNFPPLESDFIGKGIIPNHFALIRHFSDAFAPIRSLWFEDTHETANDKCPPYI